MKLKNFFIYIFLLCAVSTVGFAETWYTTQGAGSVWHGTWTKKSGTAPGPESFNIIVTYGQTIYTGNGVVWYTNKNGQGQVNATTTTSDGATCSFSGTRTGYSVTGTELCLGSSIIYPWYASISPDIEK